MDKNKKLGELNSVKNVKLTVEKMAQELYNFQGCEGEQLKLVDYVCSNHPSEVFCAEAAMKMYNMVLGTDYEVDDVVDWEY